MNKNEPYTILDRTMKSPKINNFMSNTAVKNLNNLNSTTNFSQNSIITPVKASYGVSQNQRISKMSTNTSY